MPIGKPSFDAFFSELSFIEMEQGRLLDDDSLRLIAEVRGRELITDEEWIRIKQFIRDALEDLSHEAKTAVHSPDGQIIVDPDADPRNADWLRIDAACRLSSCLLPTWAALWLWWLRTDQSKDFWYRVGRIARRLGFPKFASDEVQG